MIRLAELAEPMTMKEARTILGRSVSDVSGAMGISASVLTEWEEGQSYPTIEQFKRLCDLYRVNYELIKPIGCTSGITLFSASALLRIAQGEGISCNELLQELSF